MNFEMTDDRRMLADSLNRYLTDRYPFAYRASVAYDAPFHSPDRWADLANLGALLALADERQGGFGGGGFDVVTVFESVGRALCPEPILPALMAVRLLRAAGRDLEPVLTGQMRYALAFAEAEAPDDPEDGRTYAQPVGTGWHVSGRKTVVYGAQVADRLLVTAHLDGQLAVFEIEANQAERQTYGLIDGGGAGEVVLTAAPAARLDIGPEAVRDALDWGRLALCAEAVGAIDVTCDATLDYLKTRKQFGRAIGSFQVLQHRMVDLKTEAEQARSITILAASRMGTDGQARSVSMAKSLIGKVAQLVAEEAIQLHGGIAMTWDYSIAHYAKRLVMIDAQLGDRDYHLGRVADEYRAG